MAVLQAYTNYTSLVNQGLENQVVYRVWLVAEDSLGNVQTALSSVTFTTVRTTPPSFEELIVQYNAPTSFYIEVRCVAWTRLASKYSARCRQASFLCLTLANTTPIRRVNDCKHWQ